MNVAAYMRTRIVHIWGEMCILSTGTEQFYNAIDNPRNMLELSESKWKSGASFNQKNLKNLRRELYYRGNM